MVGQHHQDNGYEFEQAWGVGDGQRSLVYCSPWGHKGSDRAELLKLTEAHTSVLTQDLGKTGGLVDWAAPSLRAQRSSKGKFFRQKLQETYLSSSHFEYTSEWDVGMKGCEELQKEDSTWEEAPVKLPGSIVAAAIIDHIDNDNLALPQVKTLDFIWMLQKIAKGFQTGDQESNKF